MASEALSTQLRELAACVAGLEPGVERANAKGALAEAVTTHIDHIAAALDAVEWRDMATNPPPKGVVVIGLRDPSQTGRMPAFIGELYDIRKDALLDQWSGRWAVVTHWRHLGPLPVEG